MERNLVGLGTLRKVVVVGLLLFLDLLIRFLDDLELRGLNLLGLAFEPVGFDFSLLSVEDLLLQLSPVIFKLGFLNGCPFSLFLNFLKFCALGVELRFLELCPLLLELGLLDLLSLEFVLGPLDLGSLQVELLLLERTEVCLVV